MCDCIRNDYKSVESILEQVHILRVDINLDYLASHQELLMELNVEYVLMNVVLKKDKKDFVVLGRIEQVNSIILR
jgi:hypothetical protein